MNDSHHLEASGVLRGVSAEGALLVTTNWITGESYTLIRRRLGFRAAWGFLERIRASTVVEYVHVPPEYEQVAEDILVQFQGQDFSYVDATSVATMRRMGLREAFAYDHHFEIAGFVLTHDER